MKSDHEKLRRLAAAVDAWLSLHGRPKGVEEAEGRKAYQELLNALRAAKR